MTNTIDRRRFLLGSAMSLAVASCSRLLAQTISFEGVSAAPMEPWRPGFMDIHHIATGRGNSVLAIFPDGTSMMVDAGAVGGPTAALGPSRPDATRRPGEWIGRYALQHLRTAPRQELDYFVLSHFHGDHMGDTGPDTPIAAGLDYRLTGVSDVAELIPIRRLIDRGFPTYDYPAPLTGESALNYMRFARSVAKHGTTVDRLKVGSKDQIVLQHLPSAYPSVTIRGLAANGVVWTGTNNDVKTLFPPLASLQPEQYPTENSCSIALRLSYGAFRYYVGGDLTCDTNFGTAPWMDVETAVAKAAGPVNVSALDHHGYYDATGPDFVRSMHSRVYILQAWHASHPALAVLNELYSQVLVAGPRDVFSTGIVMAASLADARLSDKMLSQHGHVVVRVAPGGGSYEVIVLDETSEEGRVQLRSGPYVS